MRKFALWVKVVVTLLFVFSSIAYGQSQTVTGSVKDADKNTPLQGVTIKVLGTNTVAQTNEKGIFTIKASAGQTLIVSYVSYEQEKAVIGKSGLSFLLKAKSSELEDVVVTAMDIKRKPRELGYSVQTVKGKDIQETQRDNFVNSLQGRVSGLTVTPTTGLAGASSSIVLRGFNSLSLSNQPLFVVDGVIMDNQTIDENNNGGAALGLTSSLTQNNPNRTNDYTNRIADLNPNDIESVTVLKGPEATALYGSQASSGAIIISTKKIKTGAKFGVTYDNSFRFQEVNRFPQVNNDYAPGSNGTVAAPSTNGLLSGNFTYFGPAYPSGLQKFDNVKSFFKTGFSQTHNIGLDFGTKKSSFRFSGSFFDQDGVIPNNTYKKASFRLSNYTKVTKNLDFSASLSYTNSINNKPVRGAGGYLLDLYVWPVDNDIRNYVADSKGNKILLYNTNYNADIDNPIWNAKYNKSQDLISRWVATLGVNYNPFSWLNIAGRFGYDTYNSNGYLFIHPESYLLSAATGGSLDNYWRNYYGYNHTITATAKKTIGNWSGSLMGGTMWQDYQTQMYAISGTNFTDSVRTDSGNTRPNTRLRLQRALTGQYNLSTIREIAYFGQATLSYKNFLYFQYSHRFESASTLPAQNRNYNYPAGSVSLILTDLFPSIKRNNFLNYAKLRSSLASTARLNDPYSNQSYFVPNYSSSSIQGYSYYYTNNNPNLMPERQHTYEVGGEFKFFRNIFSLDAAYYNTLCLNQISQNFRASYGTGYVLNTQNAASLRNQGVELSLDVSTINKKDFGWNIHFNFNKMWSKVIDLPKSITTEYYLADTWIYGNARGGLIRGFSTGTITGYGYLRNNQGKILITPSTGLPVVDANFLVRGDRTPNFTLGTLNSFRYKNWSLNFLWDLKIGGDIFNATEEYLTYQGKSQKTADRKLTRVIQGVLNDGYQNTANPTKNTIAITPYFLNSYYTSMPEEEFIQKNVNWFRLRDITLNYYLPSSVINKLKGLKGLSVFATGNDLILITNYRGSDPAVNGVTAGSKGVGGYGFDYGNLPTPMSINFGLRANF